MGKKLPMILLRLASVRMLVAVVVLWAASLLPEAAQAQTPLLGNLSRSATMGALNQHEVIETTSSTPASQSFRTGGDAAGYQVHSVKLDLDEVTANMELAIRSDCSGNPCDADYIALTSPSMPADGENVFPAPSNASLLAANTVYHIVLGSESGEGPSWRIVSKRASETVGDVADAGGAAGWSINSGYNNYRVEDYGFFVDMYWDTPSRSSAARFEIRAPSTDPGVLTATVNSDTVDEGEDLEFVVALSGAIDQSITVDYEFIAPNSGFAADAADFESADATTFASGGTLTFEPDGDAVQTVSLTTVSNGGSSYEGDEGIVFRLHNLLPASVATIDEDGQSAAATIMAASTQPTLDFIVNELTAFEGEIYEYFVDLSGPSARPVTVDYMVSPSTYAPRATNPDTDLSGTLSGTITFPAGDFGSTGRQRIVFSAARDNTYDGPDDEAFTVTITNPTGGAGFPAGFRGRPNRSRVTDGVILDVDLPSVLSVEGVPVTVGGNEGAASAVEGSTDSTLEFRVTLSIASDMDVMVPYTLGGTASSGTDYTDGTQSGTPLANGSPLTIPAGETSGTISLTVLDDEIAEPGESVTVTLGEPMYSPEGTAKLGVVSATGTIADDDSVAMPTLTVGDASVIEGGTMVFPVSISRPSSEIVGFGYSFTAGTGVGGATDADFVAAQWTAPMNRGTIAVGQVVPVGDARLRIETIDDMIDEPNETFTVRVWALTGTPGGGVTPVGEVNAVTATGTIVDNDLPVITVSASSDIVGGTTEEGKQNLFTITRHASDISESLKVYFVVTDSGDVVSGSWTLYTFGPNQTTVSRVNTIDDMMDEEDAEVTITLTSPGPRQEYTIGTPKSARVTVTDDDNPVVSVNVLDTEVDEGEDVEFVVRRGSLRSSPLTVDVAITGGDNILAKAPPTSVEIPANRRDLTLALPTLDDETDEVASTVTLTLQSGSDYNINSSFASAEVGVNDNDLPGVTVSAGNDVAEGNDAVFTLTRMGITTGALDVSFTVSDGASVLTAAVPTSASFMVGQDTVAVTLGTMDDKVDEVDAEIELTLIAPSGSDPAYRLGEDASASLTVIDNDLPVITVEAGNDVDEGEIVEYTLSRAGVLTEELEVDILTAGGDDVLGGTLPTSVTFQADSSTATVMLVSDDDDLDEPNASVTLTIQPKATAYRLGASNSQSASVVVRDNDDTPTISIDDATVTEGGNLVFRVTLSGKSESQITAVYTIASGTPAATASSDYAGNITGTVSFERGDTEETISITTVNDEIDELSEQIIVTLSMLAPSGAVTPNDIEAIGTISDDDGRPTLSIDDAVASEGNNLVFAVSLSRMSGRQITVTYTVKGITDGTPAATSGTDYTSAATVIATFAAETTRASFTIPTTSDDIAEPNEKIEVLISSVMPTDAVDILGSDLLAIGTITDDDVPLVTVEAGSDVVENGNVEFVFTRLGDLMGELEIAFSISGGADVLAGPLPMSATFQAGSPTITVSLPADDDDVDEPDATVTLTLQTRGTAYSLGELGTRSASVDVSDNDDAPSMSIADAVTSEGGNLVFTVSLVGKSTRKITARYEITAGTPAAMAGTDYTGSATGTVTILAEDTEETISIATLKDDVDETNEQIVVTLSALAPAGAVTVGNLEAIGTITDSNATPSMSIDDATETEGDSLGFVVSLNGKSSRQITARYDIAAGTPAATAGTDYTGTVNGTVIFVAGDTKQTISVDTIDDDANEPNEVMIVTLSSLTPTGAVLGGDLEATGTITDNDGSLVTVEANADVAEGEDAEFVLTRTGLLAEELEVAFAITGGEDVLTGTVPTSATFPAGSPTVSVALATDDDDVDEPQAAVTLTLQANAAAYRLGDQIAQTASVSVSDNDATPVLSIEDTFASEGDPLEFHVTLSGKSSRRIMVDYTITGGSPAAAVGVDFTGGVTGTVTIVAGGTSQSITIPTIEDNVDEFDEYIVITLLSVVPADAIGLASSDIEATGTITDSDIPLVRVEAREASVIEGAPVDFTLIRSGDLSSPLDVRYSAWGSPLGGREMMESTLPPDATAAFPVDSRSITVTFSTVDDDVDERDAVVALTLQPDPGEESYRLPQSGTWALVDIEDNDLPAVAVSAASGTVAKGGSAIFNIARTGVLTSALTVRFAIGDGSQVLAGAPPASVVFRAGSSNAAVSLAVRDADDVEPGSTVALALHPDAAAYRLGTAGAQTASVTVSESEEPLTVSLLRPASAEVDEGDDLVFTVTLSRSSTVQVSVPFALSGSASATSDYTVNPVSPLIFPVNTTSREITVATVDDFVADDSETVVVTLQNPTGGGAVISANPALRRAVGTIRSESPAVISVESQEVDEGTADDIQTVTFDVRMRPTLPYAVNVPYEIADSATISTGVASSGPGARRSIFIGPPPSGTLHFPANSETPDELPSIDVSGDDDVNSDRVLVLELGEPEVVGGITARTPAPEIRAADSGAGQQGGASTTVSAGEIVVRNDDADGEQRSSALAHALSGLGRAYSAGMIDLIWSRADAMNGGGSQASAVVGGRRLETEAFQSGEDAAQVAKEVARLFGVEAIVPGDASLDGYGRDASGNGFKAYRQWANLPNSRGLKERTSFAVPLDATGGVGGRFVVWGRGDYRSFKGVRDAAPGIASDGSLTSAAIGFDYRLSEGALAGVALSSASGSADFAFADSTMGKGEVKSGITGVTPYLLLKPSSVVSLWGAYGVGSGSAEIDDSVADAVETDISTTLTGLGLRGRAAQMGSLDIAIKADFYSAEISADGVSGGRLLEETSSESTRLRLAMEGMSSVTQASGARLDRQFEIGARQDGGNGGEGMGVDIAGQLGIASQSGDFRLTVRGGLLLYHEQSEFSETGFGLGLEFDPGVAGRGFHLSLEPAYNAPYTTPSSSMWSADDGLGSEATDEAGAALTARLGHGYPALRDRALLTSYGEAEASEADLLLRLGAGIRPEGPVLGLFRLGVHGERSFGEIPEHKVGLKAAVGF